MTKDELKNFYNNDLKKYDLKENTYFKVMFNRLLEEGYNLFIGLDEMQDLIDRLTFWYEIKYPEREFDFYDGKIVQDFAFKKELSDLMDINQLFFRLTDNQVKFLKGNYRSKIEKEYPIYEEGKKIAVSKKVYFKINRNSNDKYYSKHKDFIISADAISGKVDSDYETLKYIDNDDITLNDLFQVFSENYADCLDFLELEQALKNNYVDNYLRDDILNFVALRLLYSKKTVPERGYKRAIRFMDEFNKRLGLNLSYDEIDKLMNNSYKEDNSKVKLLSL